MNKKFFKMTLNDGNYTIDSLVKLKHLDRSKIPTDVKLIARNVWVCTSRKKLIDFAEDHKQSMIDKLKDKLLIVENSEVIIHG